MIEARGRRFIIGCKRIAKAIRVDGVSSGFHHSEPGRTNDLRHDPSTPAAFPGDPSPVAKDQINNPQENFEAIADGQVYRHRDMQIFPQLRDEIRKAIYGLTTKA